MALKKRDLYSSLWNSADELRGSMDASQYKDYVLTLLFVKFVTDKARADHYSLIEIPEGGSFEDLVALKGKTDIGEKINIAIRKLAEANDLRGVIDNADFDDPTKLGEGKAMQERLSNLVGIFQKLDFSHSGVQGDDLLGDAYEYLMRHFATESGKSKGQFYTPAEVSQVMAKLLEIPADAPRSTTAYDPTAGSGSLLLKVAAEAPNGLTLYGQEKDNATWALAKMNMILHGFSTAELLQGDTLSDPKFVEKAKNDRKQRLTTFDFLVANPPFSVKTWTNGFNFEYDRFDGYSTPPNKNGDFAFLLHMVKSLKSTGRAAIIMPHGVLFRGHSEAVIRKELVKRGLIKAIIGLPPNLFYGTSIPACILIIDKKDAAARSGIFMINASDDFMKDGPKNRLRPRDMHKIVDTYTHRREIPGYSRMIMMDEIAAEKNDYNLNLPRYIDTSKPEDIQDLNAHIHGGIPTRDIEALNDWWKIFPDLKKELVVHLRPGYDSFTLKDNDIANSVLHGREYSDFHQLMTNTISTWWLKERPQFATISKITDTRSLIDVSSNNLLRAFSDLPLIDPYVIYEQLLQYWQTVMEDDLYMVRTDGWQKAAKPRKANIIGYDKNKKPKYEPAHLTQGSGKNARRWVMDLVPPSYIIARYFTKEQQTVNKKQQEVDDVALKLDAYITEHAVEEGLLASAINDDEKVKIESVNAAIKKATDHEELEALTHAKKLFAQQKKVKAELRKAQNSLDELVISKYPQLSRSDIESLVLDDKWGRHLTKAVETEYQVLIYQFIDRLQVLAKRYTHTLAEIDDQVSYYQSAVKHHLQEIGIK